MSKPMLGSVLSGLLQPIFEADLAAPATFWFLLQAGSSRFPACLIILRLDEGQRRSLGYDSHTFQPPLVLSFRLDIGIVPEAFYLKSRF